VLESILETKAATILEFFSGLRGSLFVTFEEGTWAAWLYDLLKPHVAKVVVCNPRKNALLKHGNKNDRIDARKLAELLHLDHLWPVYHSQNGVRMLRKLARSYPTLVKESLESDLSQLVHSLYRPGRLLYPSSRGVVEQDPGGGRTPAGRATLPATGHAPVFAPGSAARTAGGESETSHHGRFHPSGPSARPWP
jgi:hypothetical protein